MSNQHLVDIYLKLPNLSNENILGYNVGIRPFRKSGTRIQAEYFTNKLIIHNYGYGGSGLTLCWGGSQIVLDILTCEIKKNAFLAERGPVAVLGAGVIGLSTAYDLLTQGYQVNIYADKFSPYLTSNVAAGILSAPVLRENESEKQQRLINKMLKIASDRFMINAKSNHPEFIGIKFLTNYRFATNHTNYLDNKFKGFSLDEKTVRVHFDNGLTIIGKAAKQIGLDGKLFMEDLNAKVISKGASITQRFFKSKNEINELKESVIINCTSMGSRELFNDHLLMPVRGHLVYFKSHDQIDYSLYYSLPEKTDYWVKFYPWQDRLILGGMFEHGLENCEVDKTVVLKLIEYARSCFKLT